MPPTPWATKKITAARNSARNDGFRNTSTISMANRFRAGSALGVAGCMRLRAPRVPRVAISAAPPMIAPQVQPRGA